MHKKLRDHVLWGSAGHAKVLASSIELLGGRVVALFDNRPVPAALENVPLFIGKTGFQRWIAGVADRELITGLVAIGGARGRDRLAIQQFMAEHDLSIGTIVHPAAVVCPGAGIGEGTQVLAGALIAAGVLVGKGCIINHRASVDHECTLGDGVHIAPGATLCGCIEVADHVLVGAGAVVLPRLKLGADSVVGAGAVVTRDVAPGSTVAGNPARVIASTRAGPKENECK